MTLVSSIITAAFRETNLIPVGQSPSTNQQSEALDRLNNIVASSIGNEIGDLLDDITIGGTYDQSSLCTSWVPDDARLVLNLSAATTLNLDPSPYEGQQLSFVDVKGNLATTNLTLNGNGRLIEGVTSLTLNTNSDARKYFYRADTGNWTKLTTLLISDTMPFPSEFDDYFIGTLAMRLNPRYAQTTTAESIEALKRIRNLLRARYHTRKPVQSDLTTRGYRANRDGIYGFNNTDEFNSGTPWPYL